MKKKEIEKELEGLSPFLSDLKKDNKNGFSVPTNYFDRFEDRLMHRIEEEKVLEGVTSLKSETPTLSKTSFWTFFKRLMQPQYVVGFSTMILLIVFGLYFANNETGLPVDERLDGLLADAAIDNYIDRNIDEFTTDEILTVLALDEIERIQKKIIPINDVSIEPQKEETIIETQEASMDKALEVVNADDLLDDLTIDDLEEDSDELFL